MDCREIEARLPWFVNRSLSAAEQGEVEAHLGACPRCREALAATREAGELYGAHLPTEAIVDYALGLAVEDLDRAVVEGHLGHCSDCREELRLVESEQETPARSPVLAPPPASASRAPRGLGRTYALAASLAAFSALAVWFAMRDRAPVPEARVAIVELLPESSLTRGAEAGGVTLDRKRTTTLLLVTDRAENFADVRVSVAALPGAALVWRETGLPPAAEGVYALLLPAGALAPGRLEIVLEGRERRDTAEWTVIARYPVVLGP